MDIDELRDTISIQETAKRLGRSKKTIYRWVESGKLPAKRAGREYFIKVDVVESLASGQVVQRDDVVQRLDELEQLVLYRLGITERRLDALEQKLEPWLNTPHVAPGSSNIPPVDVVPLTLPQKEKPVRIASESQTGTSVTWAGNVPEGTTVRVEAFGPRWLPEGHVNYTQFYRDHGISSGVADRARGKNFFPVQVGNWHDERGHPVTLALDTLGQWNFCVYFRTKGKLRECSRQGCACHEV